MKRISVLVLLLIALLGVTVFVLAQEDPSENACYAGGVWENKCDWPTDAEDAWAWNCGWYLARLVDGRINLNQYPTECGGVSTECFPINDVFNINEPGLSGFIAAPGLLANDLNPSSCSLVSYTAPTLVTGSGIITMLLSADGSLSYAVSDVNTEFTFFYTTSNGASAKVTIRHDGGT